jgi:hypothetical protein
MYQSATFRTIATRLIGQTCLILAALNSQPILAKQSDSPPKSNSQQTALVIKAMSQLRSCDIDSWKADQASQQMLTSIESNAHLPIPVSELTPSRFGLSPAARYASALNQRARPSLRSWCEANASLFDFWLAPENFVQILEFEVARSVVDKLKFDKVLVVLFNRIPTRGLAGAVFHFSEAQNDEELVFSAAGTTALLERVAQNINSWARDDASQFAEREKSRLAFLSTVSEEADAPSWLDYVHDQDMLDEPTFLEKLAKLRDPWAAYRYGKVSEDDQASHYLTVAFDGGVTQAAAELADLHEAEDVGLEEAGLAWLERGARAGESMLAGNLLRF